VTVTLYPHPFINATNQCCVNENFGRDWTEGMAVGVPGALGESAFLVESYYKGVRCSTYQH